MKYRIINKTYTDEYGVPSKPKYQIQVYKRFLRYWMKWRYITHEECYVGDCTQEITNWDTLREAEEFAKKFLCTEKHFDGWETYIVKTGTC